MIIYGYFAALSISRSTILIMKIMLISSALNSTAIKEGPSGRAVAEQIDTDLLAAFQQHLNMERQAHTVYYAAALWCAERELRGFSKFFRDESLSELEHSAKFADFLIARGQSVELHELPAPQQRWEKPADLMATSFQMEVDVTGHCNSSTLWQNAPRTLAPRCFWIT